MLSLDECVRMALRCWQTLSTSCYRSIRSTEIWSNTRKGQVRLVFILFCNKILWFWRVLWQIVTSKVQRLYSSHGCHCIFFPLLSRVCRAINTASRRYYFRGAFMLSLLEIFRTWNIRLGEKMRGNSLEPKIFVERKLPLFLAPVMTVARILKTLWCTKKDVLFLLLPYLDPLFKQMPIIPRTCPFFLAWWSDRGLSSFCCVGVDPFQTMEGWRVSGPCRTVIFVSWYAYTVAFVVSL